MSEDLQQASPVALAAEDGQGALVAAARAMADDYQTSPKHHPQHVLVPIAAFEAMRAALGINRND